MKEKITAIILAAGKSQRMNSDVQKQYMIICGKPVLYYSLQAFSDSPVDDIVVVTGKDEIDLVRKNIVDRYGFTKVSAIVAGGRERYDSTWAGLQACPASDYVLIHDAARPVIQEDVIERAIEGVLEYKAVVVGMPAKDTIRLADEKEYAVDTPPRRKLWTVQTPQAFSYDLIYKAYENMWQTQGGEQSERGSRISAKPITDDAMVVETYGDTQVKLVLGDYMNIKITTIEDVCIVENFLKILSEKK